MKYFIFVSFLLLTSQSFAHNNMIIDEVKKNSKVIKFLKNTQGLSGREVSYHQMPLNSICGFAGCQSVKLVNIMVSSTSANAPVTNLLAKVTLTGLEQEKMKVTIVELENVKH